MNFVAWLLMLVAAGWVGFAYAGYPLLMLLISRISPRSIAADDIYPPITLIIAVHNGEAVIESKLESTLSLEYPNAIEILVASDHSTDATDQIVQTFAAHGVRLVGLGERGGKEAAQAAAISVASHEILVFTDVTAELTSSALMAIVRPFADPEVGAVSSEDEVDSEGGEGAYVRLEMALRRMETQAGSLVGLSGSFFAVRRTLAIPWPSHLASDFRLALEVAKRGSRAVCEPTATAKFRATEGFKSEWHRKVRTVRRGLAVLSTYRGLLSPRHGRIAFSLWGHKVARFTSPFALLLLLIGNWVVAQSSMLGQALLASQFAVYALGCFALLFPSVSSWRPARLAGFFLLVNASMLVAWGHHLSGRRAVTWDPTRR